MKKFEYKKLQYFLINSLSDDIDNLNIAGKQGWELTSTIVIETRNVIHFLKRELRQEKNNE